MASGGILTHGPSIGHSAAGRVGSATVAININNISLRRMPCASLSNTRQTTYAYKSNIKGSSRQG